MNWAGLGNTPSNHLVDARLQLHWATQIIASAPITFLEPEPDASHANLGWLAASDTLVARPVGQEPALQVGLRLPELTLVVLTDRGQPIEEFKLDGKTLDDGYAWLTAALAKHSAGRLTVTSLQPTGPELPAHPVGESASFDAKEGESFAELARWYANSFLVLSEVESANPGASPVRCWPHHFDVATLITVSSASDPDQIRSVGVGMTPGDQYYAEPYYYVTPWPYPDQPVLPQLDGGSWHTEEWIGAVLTGTQVASAGENPDSQLSLVRRFVQSAVPAARSLLDR
jgi:hypothetical protein